MSSKDIASTYKTKNFPWNSFTPENIVLFCFVLLSLTISLLPINYGYFIDELYSIDLSKHLAWGYVAIPPLMPWGLALDRFLFGDSLFAIHIFSAIIGAVVLVLTREMARKLGAKLFAQILAMTCVLMAPVSMAIHARITYDNYDFLFWTLCLYTLVLLLTTENKKYWLYLGLFAGLGLMSKFTILFLALGVVGAMLCTKERKYFLSWQLWLGGGIALLIFSPYLLGVSTEIHRATLEYMATYHQGAAPLTLGKFVLGQIFSLNPFTFPVWLLGLYYFLFNQAGKKFRLFGIAYFIMVAACLIQQTKYYVILPFYPILFAGGAVFCEKLMRNFKSLKIIIIANMVLIVLFGLIAMPAVRPLLPPDVLVNYLVKLHMFKPGSQMGTEHRKQALLPQDFADRFGWEEMVAKVAQIYYSLPEEQRKNTVIFCNGYGAPGAINLFGKKYNLPEAVSPYLQHFFWGSKNLKQDSTLIIKGYKLEDIQKSCIEIKLAGVVANKYAMPDGTSSTGPIYLCRGFKGPVQQIWQHARNMRL